MYCFIRIVVIFILKYYLVLYIRYVYLSNYIFNFLCENNILEIF